MDEAFRSEMTQGYAAVQPVVVLGSPMHVGEILADVRVGLPLSTANRHGLVAGATGTGKTKTLQLLAGQLSAAGVPVFVANVKGDLTGLAVPGDPTDAKIQERSASLTWTFTPTGHPVELLSLTGALGAPVRATISSFGPLLLGKVMDLNETQTSVLSMVFAYCDDHDLALLDIADLRTTLQFLSSDSGKSALEPYGGMSRSTVGVLLRALVTMEQEGIGEFFGEPAFDVEDLLRTTPEGAGVISLLELSDVMTKPRLFSTFLLWMLAQLYGALPEVSDLPKPKLAFFFDEAHLLFDDASEALMEQIELTARLIRSKGVGVYFVTQSPTDVPSSVLSQLGNRIQHALRAFTPQDADDLRKTARTFPSTRHYDVEEAITSLGIGEALITVLLPNGVPSPLAATRLIPPDSQMSPAEPAVLERLVNGSPLRVKYLEAPDRESAHEVLSAQIAAAKAAAETAPAVEGPKGRRRRSTTPRRAPSKRAEKSATQRAIEAGLKTVSTAEGQRTIRVLFGTLFGKK
ncbi:MAG TPA: helicase HerA-like domain-containing protein [Actinomycetota bacterium]|nr:helicase HerA-like domain-containing protein [Actinomycetota bacterium]